MHENRFVAIGRIMQMSTTARGLHLVLGGPGPSKAIASVEIRDPALLRVITQSDAGFAVGDIVSVSGHNEFDPSTGMNVAIAAPDRVSRISRASAAPTCAHSAPIAADAGPSSRGNFFGGRRRQQACASTDPDIGPSPPLPASLPPLTEDLQWHDIPF